MNKNGIINWGIIGLGKIADKFATDLVNLGNVNLVAVASRSKERATTFAKKFNVDQAYDSYHKLAQDPNVDAVYIATPHSFHKEHSILCLEHKKAVLCEKPFAMNLVEVNEMIATAKKNNVLLMEALWTYFLPQYRFVLDIYETKKYGHLIDLKADFGFFTTYDTESRLFKKEVGGGSLLDIGIYPIFVALSTLGIPNKINAKAQFFENGADASCDMVFNYDKSKAYLKSTLLEETSTEAIFTFEKAKVIINTRFHEPSTVTVIQDNNSETLDFNYKSIGYNFEADHFSQLLREDKKESTVMSFNFSRKLIKILDDVRAKIDLKY
jgi:predicted dehydrogenase